MQDWLLDRYKGSTFNTCPHRPLPCMTGPPVEIHMEETAVPKTCHNAAPIPLHWQDQVKKDFLRDEALEVIEKVPYGEPVTWCHRMVVTRKHDGSPRSTVDLCYFFTIISTKSKTFVSYVICVLKPFWPTI